LSIKWAGDFSGNLNLALNASAGDEGRVEAGQNFTQREAYQHAVTIIFPGKNIRHSLAKFTKGDFHGTPRELGEDFFQRDGNAKIADVSRTHLWLELERQAAQNTRQRHFDPSSVAGTVAGGRIPAHGWPGSGRLGGFRLWRFGLSGLIARVYAFRCGAQRFAQQILKKSKHKISVRLNCVCRVQGKNYAIAGQKTDWRRWRGSLGLWLNRLPNRTGHP